MLTYGALALLLAIPVLVGSVPLGVDDLNHLARIQVRAHIGTDPDLAHLFRIRHQIIPYLGMDVLLTPLARLLPVMLVGRLFILALVWGLVGAVVVLRRAFTGRVGLAPAAAGLIAYNGLMAWGLINYVLGLILALLVFALWHAQRDRPWLVRLVVFTGAATMIYLTHLLAFVVYGILVCSYEVFGRSHSWRTPVRDWGVLIGQALPAFVLWVILPAKMSGVDLAPAYLLPVAKVLAMVSPFYFRGATGGLDTGTFTFVAGAVLLIVALRRGFLTWPRTLKYPALVLLALAIILPFRIMGVALIDYRFPVVVVCLALAGVRVTRPRLSWTVPVAAVAAMLTLVHVTGVTMLMHRCDGQYAELRDALEALPRGATLTTVLERSDPVPGVACTSLPIYLHMAQLVTIDRSGYAPDFFSRVTSVAVRGGRPTDTDPIPAKDFKSAPEGGYVLWFNLGRSRPVPPGLVLLRQGSFFNLWRVRHG